MSRKLEIVEFQINLFLVKLIWNILASSFTTLPDCPESRFWSYNLMSYQSYPFEQKLTITSIVSHYCQHWNLSSTVQCPIARKGLLCFPQFALAPLKQFRCLQVDRRRSLSNKSWIHILNETKTVTIGYLLLRER